MATLLETWNTWVDAEKGKLPDFQYQYFKSWKPSMSIDGPVGASVNPVAQLYKAKDDLSSAVKDPVAFAKGMLQEQGNTSVLQSYGNLPYDVTKIRPIADYLRQNGVSTDEMQTLVKAGQDKAIQNITALETKQNSSFLDVLFPVALSFIAPGLGSAIAAELGVSTAVGNALASAGLQAAQGKDLTDIASSILTGSIGNAIAAPVAELTDSAALGNIAANTASGLISGQDLEQALTGSLINQGINTVAETLAPDTEIPVPDFNEQTAGLQDVYGGNLSVEDIVAGFDTVNPLADTTTDLDTAFLQDMGQPIEVPQVPLDYLAADAAQTEANDINAMADVGNQPVVTETPPNLEGGDLGMTEEEAQNQFYEEIGLNPETVVDTPAVSTSGDTPEIPQEVTNNLTKEQIAKLLKTGINLFGGLAAASKGLSALSGGSTPTMPAIGGGTMPTIQAPTPFTGTYSGLNPYSADYYQQVQQNYNRLFPTVPVDVATPLQSWYQTQFVPDTTISNKLFGV